MTPYAVANQPFSSLQIERTAQTVSRMAPKLNLDLAKINALFSPAALREFNAFLEQLPARLGINILVIAGVVWAAAFVMIFYTSMEAKKLVETRTTLQKTEALTPPVPTISKSPVDQAEIEKFTKAAESQYQGLKFGAEGGKVTISAENTALFGRFKESILQLFNSGIGWRASLTGLCVGRECVDKGGALLGTFQVNRLTVTPPSGDGTK